MSKRALVAYSDALRLEHGDAITVTTVYPGFIKTPIHDASNEDGFALDGIVAEEPLASAAATLVRAALGRPVRDLATTRQGTIGYALARRAPRAAAPDGLAHRAAAAPSRGARQLRPLADGARLRRAPQGLTVSSDTSACRAARRA